MPETLEITTVGDAQLMYSFIVDGDVQPADAGNGVTAVGELESEGGNVTIQNRTDGTIQVDGQTGSEFGDAFTIDGTLVTFTGNISNDQTNLALGGETIQPANLPLSTEQEPPPDDENGNGENGDGENGENGNGENGNGDQQPPQDGLVSFNQDQVIMGILAAGLAWELSAHHFGDD